MVEASWANAAADATESMAAERIMTSFIIPVSLNSSLLRLAYGAVSSAEAMPPLLCAPDPVIVLKFALKDSESAEIRRPHLGSTPLNEPIQFFSPSAPAL